MSVRSKRLAVIVLLAVVAAGAGFMITSHSPGQVGHGGSLEAAGYNSPATSPFALDAHLDLAFAKSSGAHSSTLVAKGLNQAVVATPEVPSVLLLPVVCAGLLLGAVVLDRRRRYKLGAREG